MWTTKNHLSEIISKANTPSLTCAYSSVLRGCKPVPLGHNNGRDAQDTDHNQVDEAGLRIAVERVVEPWDKAAHYEKGNTRVVQPKGAEKKWQDVTIPYL